MFDTEQLLYDNAQWPINLVMMEYISLLMKEMKLRFLLCRVIQQISF